MSIFKYFGWTIDKVVEILPMLEEFGFIAIWIG